MGAAASLPAAGSSERAGAKHDGTIASERAPTRLIAPAAHTTVLQYCRKVARTTRGGRLRQEFAASVVVRREAGARNPLVGRAFTPRPGNAQRLQAPKSLHL